MAESNESLVKLTATEIQQSKSNGCLAIENLKQTSQFSVLNIEQKLIFEALDNTRIKHIPFDDFVLKMNDLITFIHSACGQPLDENHTISLLPLCTDMQRYYGTLTFEEVQICFNNGYKEVYGKYYGLNNKSYFSWLENYTFSENRVKAVGALSNAKYFIENPPKPKPTEQEISDSNKKLVLMALEDVKKGNERVLDVNNVVYDYLDGLKLIPFTKEEKNAMLAEIKRELIAEQQNQLMTPDLLHAKTIKSLIESYRVGEPIPNEFDKQGKQLYKPHISVLCETKRYALTLFLKNLITNKTDINKLLDDAIEKKESQKNITC